MLVLFSVASREWSVCSCGGALYLGTENKRSTCAGSGSVSLGEPLTSNNSNRFVFEQNKNQTRGLMVGTGGSGVVRGRLRSFGGAVGERGVSGCSNSSKNELEVGRIEKRLVWRFVKDCFYLLETKASGETCVGWWSRSGGGGGVVV